MPQKALHLTTPTWVDELVDGFGGRLVTDEERLHSCIELSRANLERGGGPFGALVFADDRLIAASVNRVLDTGLSIAHAEILAMLHAQALLFENRQDFRGPYTLYASTEPCCQCFGALIWARMDRLVFGAGSEDAEAIGFDEGPKPEDWVQALQARGIAVTGGVLREQAAAVLKEYERRGLPIY